MALERLEKNEGRYRFAVDVAGSKLVGVVGDLIACSFSAAGASSGLGEASGLGSLMALSKRDAVLA
ncbi:hypothetical protein NC651_000005 [Populus alba x Populus x berolinensis]|nr:hypothetical protein NC651_000005 [Populus alba x Populus x berolinensis]